MLVKQTSSIVISSAPTWGLVTTERPTAQTGRLNSIGLQAKTPCL